MRAADLQEAAAAAAAEAAADAASDAAAFAAEAADATAYTDNVAAARAAVDTANAADAYAADTIRTAGKFDPNYFFWRAIEDDASALVNRWPHQKFNQTPLWFSGTPSWIREPWYGLRDHLLAANEGWEVWTDWYQDRLDGKQAIEELEVARALIPNKIWEEGPAALNAETDRLIAADTVGRPESPKLDRSTVERSIREQPAHVSSAAHAFGDAAKERIEELEQRLPGINNPETEAEVREELTKLRGDFELAMDVADHVDNLQPDPSDNEVEAATEKALSLAERVDQRVRNFLGKRTTGVGNLLWVGAGSVFLMAVGIPVHFAVPVAGISLAVGKVGQMADAAAKIADAVAKVKKAAAPETPEQDS